MFLTDWGPTERYLRRSGAEHKRTAIRRLLAAYPGKDFVLIGDSGQRDPLTYAEIAREHPGRVRLILIRQVGDDDDERNVEVAAHGAVMREQGIPLHLVADAAAAARIAHAAGLCDEDTLAEVAQQLNSP
jgi:phosphatidate phosphatase APP1